MIDNARRIAIVTGAAQGIGRACAERLARDGFAVAAVDRQSPDECVAAITGAGGTARGYRCDMTQPAAIAATFSAIAAELGNAWVLVNNAGRYDFTPHDSSTFEDWRKIMDLNLDGMYLATQQAIPQMKALGGGRIINLISNSIFFGVPGLSAYIASKAGSMGFVRAMATELGAFGITVNAVAPGPTITPGTSAAFHDAEGNFDQAGFDAMWEHMVSMQALPMRGLPEYAAAAVAFFASDDAQFITGQSFVVDGGNAKH